MGRKMVGKVCILGGGRCPSKSDHQVKSQNCLEKCVKVGGGRCPSKSDHQVKSQKLHLNSLSVWGGKCLEKCVFWGENDAPAKVTIK